jgi:hypothetical protein
MPFMGGFKGEYLVNLFRGEDVVLELHYHINDAKLWLITPFFLFRVGGLCLYLTDFKSPKKFDF